MTTTVCEYLDWDSEFFNCRIARVLDIALNTNNIDEILIWCHQNNIDCLYYLCESDNRESIRHAEDNGFRMVDIRVTYRKDLKNMQLVNGHIDDEKIHLCTYLDISELKAIAGLSYSKTRFFNDHFFSDLACRKLYQTWIEKSCNGDANAVLVIDIEGRPKGYVSCILIDGQLGQIGLLGVDVTQQNAGLGEILVTSSLAWFAQRKIETVRVVTQGQNLPANRLYQKCGFRMEEVQIWYHKWFSQKDIE